MAAPLKDWKPFTQGPVGPVRVERQDGDQVVYGARAAATAVGGLAQVKKTADVELTVYDELGHEVTTVNGDDVVSLDFSGVVTTVVVGDDVDREPGPRVVTRGAEAPTAASTDISSSRPAAREAPPK